VGLTKGIPVKPAHELPDRADIVQGPIALTCALIKAAAQLTDLIPVSLVECAPESIGLAGRHPGKGLADLKDLFLIHKHSIAAA